MTIEQLAELDPARTARFDDVPTRTALLDQIDRSSGMAQRTDTIRNEVPRPSPPQRRRWLATAATFLAVLAVVGVAVLFRGDTGSRDFTTPDTTTPPTTETADPLAEATAIVQAMVDNYNTGNVQTWLTSFTDGAEIYTDAEDQDPVVRQESLMLANSRWELISCRENEIQFEGSYPTLACDLTLSDDFVGRFLSPQPFPVTYRFIIGPDAEISQMVGLSREWWIKQERFVAAFNEWLEAAHPEVDAGFQPRLFGGLPAPADMPTALEYADEFIEQSGSYPLP